MEKILQVISRGPDELAEAVASANRASGAQVEVIKLTGKEVDYQKLLEAIFKADLVQSW